MLSLVLSVAIAAAPSCVAPEIIEAKVVNVGRERGLNAYRIGMTIANRGGAQPQNTMQFVQIYNGRQHLEEMPMRPLQSGATYTAYYTFRRATTAGDGTTNLHLRVDVQRPRCAPSPVKTITL